MSSRFTSPRKPRMNQQQINDTIVRIARDMDALGDLCNYVEYDPNKGRVPGHFEPMWQVFELVRRLLSEYTAPPASQEQAQQPSGGEVVVAKRLVELADIMRDCGRLVSKSGAAEACLREAARMLATTKPEPMTWQPIETAPKDGTEVLLLFSKAEYILGKPHGRVRAACWAGSGSSANWSIPYYKDDAPTAWQPLPAPPSLAAAQAKGADPEDLAAAGVMLMGRRADRA